jgi:hypothetical protein
MQFSSHRYLWLRKPLYGFLRSQPFTNNYFHFLIRHNMQTLYYCFSRPNCIASRLFERWNSEPMTLSLSAAQLLPWWNFQICSQMRQGIIVLGGLHSKIIPHGNKLATINNVTISDLILSSCSALLCRAFLPLRNHWIKRGLVTCHGLTLNKGNIH